jgi:hypothetical protein
VAKLQLEGTLTIGPPCAVECCSGVDAAEATLPVCVKLDAAAVVGTITRTVASPASFITLSGIGASDAVTQGSFLYVVTDSEMTLRITCDDGAGGTALELIPVHGLFARQFPATKPLELLEVRGSGRITYAACGPR